MKLEVIAITVEVHCEIPSWAKNHAKEQYRDSKYRIYVDDDLLTERDWSWSNSIYIRENIWVRIDPFLKHKIWLEPVVFIPEQAVFGLMNLKVKDQNFKIPSRESTSIDFEIIDFEPTSQMIDLPKNNFTLT